MNSLLAATRSRGLLPLLRPSSQHVRCISQKLFLGGLPPETTDQDVKEFFADFDSLKSVSVKPRNEKNSFGFVDFGDVKHALAALDEMEIRRFKGRLLYVKFAKKPAWEGVEPPRPFGMRRRDEQQDKQRRPAGSKWTSEGEADRSSAPTDGAGQGRSASSDRESPSYRRSKKKRFGNFARNDGGAAPGRQHSEEESRPTDAGRQHRQESRPTDA